ncbi:MAG: hypothetical protein U5R48_18090 [Gammaproteobacteria bacterium]|nr:hypothetical protein [Gammaproteobacteria bacterium]
MATRFFRGHGPATRSPLAGIPPSARRRDARDPLAADTAVAAAAATLTTFADGSRALPSPTPGDPTMPRVEFEADIQPVEVDADSSLLDALLARNVNAKMLCGRRGMCRLPRLRDRQRRGTEPADHPRGAVPDDVAGAEPAADWPARPG